MTPGTLTPEQQAELDKLPAFYRDLAKSYAPVIVRLGLEAAPAQLNAILSQYGKGQSASATKALIDLMTPDEKAEAMLANAVALELAASEAYRAKELAKTIFEKALGAALAAGLMFL